MLGARIEGQHDLKDMTKLFLGMQEGISMYFWNTHIYSYTSFSSFTDYNTWSSQYLFGRIEDQTNKREENIKLLPRRVLKNSQNISQIYGHVLHFHLFCVV